MSQVTNYEIANASGASVRSDLNDVFAAIVSQNAGAIEPVPTPTGTNPASYAYMLWADTGGSQHSPPDSVAANKLRMRNGANSGWIHIGDLDQTGLNIVAHKFPNVTTNVTLTSAQLNNAVYLPSGTKMVFYQSSPPTDWKQDTDNNDKALRVVSGSGGVSGGTTSFSTLAHSHTGSSGSSVAPTQSHTHVMHDAYHAESYTTTDLPETGGNEAVVGSNSTIRGSGDSDGNNDWFFYRTKSTEATGGTAGHTHTVGVSSDDITPKYIDVIVCSKD